MHHRIESPFWCGTYHSGHIIQCLHHKIATLNVLIIDFFKVGVGSLQGCFAGYLTVGRGTQPGLGKLQGCRDHLFVF